MARLCRIVFELLAQAADIDTQVVGMVAMSWPPHLIHKVAMGKHSSGIGGQYGQQSILALG